MSAGAPATGGNQGAPKSDPRGQSGQQVKMMERSSITAQLQTDVCDVISQVIDTVMDGVEETSGAEKATIRIDDPYPAEGAGGRL